MIHQPVQKKPVISSIIDSNGYVTNSAIKKSLHPAYDSIALKVIAEMPQWKPATQDDKFVNTNYDIPVRFDALDMAIVQMDKKASKTKRNKQEQASGEINSFTLEGEEKLSYIAIYPRHLFPKRALAGD